VLVKPTLPPFLARRRSSSSTDVFGSNNSASVSYEPACRSRT